MQLSKSFSIAGKHAFLSPSTYHWLDDDEDGLRARYFNKQQAAQGDRLHAYAATAIELRQRQAEMPTTMSMYINDAIGFRMQAEVPLVYSEDCFGTCDAISIREEKWPDGTFFTLRISDLKTGITPASMKQLLIYTALFFKQYEKLFSPDDVRVILRIYQNDAIEEYCPNAAEIRMVMSKVAAQARLIAYLRKED